MKVLLAIFLFLPLSLFAQTYNACRLKIDQKTGVQFGIFVQSSGNVKSRVNYDCELFDYFTGTFACYQKTSNADIDFSSQNIEDASLFKIVYHGKIDNSKINTGSCTLSDKKDYDSFLTLPVALDMLDISHIHRTDVAQYLDNIYYRADTNKENKKKYEVIKDSYAQYNTGGTGGDPQIKIEDTNIIPYANRLQDKEFERYHMHLKENALAEVLFHSESLPYNIVYSESKALELYQEKIQRLVTGIEKRLLESCQTCAAKKQTYSLSFIVGQETDFLRWKKEQDKKDKTPPKWEIWSFMSSPFLKLEIKKEEPHETLPNVMKILELYNLTIYDAKMLEKYKAKEEYIPMALMTLSNINKANEPEIEMKFKKKWFIMSEFKNNIIPFFEERKVPFNFNGDSARPHSKLAKLVFDRLLEIYHLIPGGLGADRATDYKINASLPDDTGNHIPFPQQ